MQALHFTHPSDGHRFTPATLVEVLRFRATYQGTHRAFTFLPDGEAEGACVTYAELDERARAVAAYLQNITKPDETVLLLFPQGLEFLAAFFGCLYAGRIAVPSGIPKAHRPDARILAIAADAGATVALTTSVFANGVAGCPHEDLRLHPLDAIDLNLSTDWVPPPISRTSLAFLQYTSGSTSVPKGVMVTHGNVLYNSCYIHHDFDYQPSSVAVTWLPHFHDMGLLEGLLQPILHGFPGYLMPAVYFLQQPVKWLSALSTYRATHSGGPNFAYDLCTRKITSEEAARLDLSTWRVAYNGAEPVRIETLRRFARLFSRSGFTSASFYPAYGLAEATLKVSGGFTGVTASLLTVRSSALLQHRVEEAEEDEPNRQTFVSCGRPSLSTEVKIVRPDTGQPCEAAEVGEIWVSGPGIAQGYWKRADESEHTFLASRGHGEGRRYLRTGDLGFVRSGELFVTGRLKDLIIVNGRNHYPADIEQTVEVSSPAVRPGCTAAFSIDLSDEEQVVLVAEIHRTNLAGWKDQGYADAQFEQAFRAIQQAVTEQHDLRIFCFIFIRPGTIPKTSSGKIQRSVCKQRFLAGTLPVVSQVGAGGGRPPVMRA